MNLQRCFLWSAEIQMIFIDHNHRYLGKEYVVSKTTDNSDGAWTYVIVNEVFVPEKIVEGIPSCLKV